MEGMNELSLSYVDSTYAKELGSRGIPNEYVISKAICEQDYESLSEIIVVPGNGKGNDVFFCDEIWTNMHLIEGRETYRKANFSQLSVKIKLEIKIIGLYLIWFSARKAKISSIIRIIENLILIGKCLDRISVKSIYWLDREPIRDRFCAEFSKGRTDGTIDNYYKALSRLCDMKHTFFGRYGLYLNTNFLLLSPGRTDNQHYCMPMRILNSYWKSYSDYFSNLHVNSDNWEYLGRLPKRYREYLIKNNLKHHNNNWLYYLDTFCQERLKEIANASQCNTKELVTVRADSQVQDYKDKQLTKIEVINGVRKKVPVSTYNRRYPKYLVDMEEIYTFYNRQALIACEAIQAFTGMRKSEATTITFGSLIDEQNWIGVKANLYKYADEGGVEEWWAAPPVVKGIYAKMRLLGEGLFGFKGKELDSTFIKSDARRFHAHGKLSLMRDQRSSEKQLDWSHRHDIYIGEADVEEFWRLNPNISDRTRVESEIFVGATWPVSSHQFRRSIAVHVRRLELVSIRHLAIHLKHLGKTIAEWYSAGALANSKAPGRIAEAFVKEIEKAGLERAASLAMRFQDGKNLYGRGGKRLEDAKQGGEQTQVYQSYAHAYSLAKRRKSKVMSLGNGMYCMNGQDCDFKPITQSASCRRDCENLVADDESIPLWKQRYDKYRGLFLKSKREGLPEASQEFYRLEMLTYQEALEFYGVDYEQG